MIPANQLSFAIVGHLIGDYLLQNDWMANNKKKNSIICSIHCLIWTFSVLLLAGPSWWIWWVPIVLFATHFIQDRTKIINWYMNKMGQTGFAKNLAPWSIIAVDNTMHIATLTIIARCL